ncbi:MAG: class I SAM-dependent methyltransferase, partial [Acidobacteriota bacterium]
ELIPDGGSILEVGSGSGRLSCYLAMAGFKTVCLDSSRLALRAAQANYSRERVAGSFVLGDGFSLPFADEAFDVVMSTGLLEHFDNPSPIVAEMVRSLRPGGTFYSDVVPRKFSLFRSLDWVAKLNSALFGGPAAADPLYERTFTAEQIRALMKSCGLEHGKVFPAGVVPPYLPLLSRSRRLLELQVQMVERTRQFWKLFDGTLVASLFGFYYFAWARKPNPHFSSVSCCGRE